MPMKRKRASRAATLSIAVAAEGADLPTEFRLFVSGWNTTENGAYLFDATSAETVMAAYEAHDVARMIDLEHLSLDTESASFDPDARGWCKIELRDDGSLWATDVTWTPDGAARLTDKRQRYVSPAFGVDTKTKRITDIFNIALTALPATHHAPELVAARTRDLRKLSTGPAFSDVEAAIAATFAELFPATDAEMTGPWIVDVFDATVVYQRDGKFYEVPYTFNGSTATLGGNPVEVNRSYTPASKQATPPTPPAAPFAATRTKPTAKLAVTGASAMDPKLVGEALDALIAGDAEKCQEILKGLVATAAGGEATPPAAEEPPPPAEMAAADPAEEEDQAAMVAATARLTRITGKATLGEALEEVTRLSAIAADYQKKEAQHEKERAALEMGRRKENAATLVKLGAETPHTSGLATGKLVKRLIDEPIAEQNARVAALLAARGGKLPADVKPPTEALAHGLSERELEMCAAKKIDPAAYAKTRAGIRARNVQGQGV